MRGTEDRARCGGVLSDPMRSIPPLVTTGRPPRSRPVRGPLFVAAAVAIGLLVAVFAGVAGAVTAVAADVAAGPPFPAPTTGVRVYDQAGIFSPAARSSAEATIKAIEDRSHAQVVVYTQ